MNTQPSMESRMSAIERRQNYTDARIEDVYTDMTASFKQISGYFGKLEDRLGGLEATTTIILTHLNKHEGRFDKLEGRFDKLEVTAATKQDIAVIQSRLDNLEGRFDNLAGRFDNLEGRFDNLAAAVATKDDLAAMETRILGVFKQLLISINPQQSPQ